MLRCVIDNKGMPEVLYSGINLPIYVDLLLWDFISIHTFPLFMFNVVN